MATAAPALTRRAVRPGAPPKAADAQRRPAPRWWLRCLVIYALSRVVAVAASVVSFRTGPLAHAARALRISPDPRSIWAPLDVWDSGWYVHIATHGYSTQLANPDPYSPGMAFFPLFPLLIRALHAATGLDPWAAAPLLALAGGAVALLAIHRLMADVGGPRLADRAVLVLAFFPGSLYLSYGYSEGVTLALVALCLLWLRQHRWLAAGLAAAGASASHPIGAVLGLACAWAVVPELRRRHWRALVAPALAPLGIFGYFGWLWAMTGDPRAWFDVVHKIWHAPIRLGSTTLDMVHNTMLWPAAPDNWIPSVGLLLLVWFVVALLWWRPPGIVLLYGLVAMTLPMLSAPSAARPRYFLLAFPLVVAGARSLPRWAVAPVTFVFAACMVGLAYLETTGVGFTP
ncbi:MAG TPA: glycosyltransferase 87 family protein [Acidimicrobiales bacterium]|nr:glycosyltransferase 87 family protein [Acidimicrobiales bacterium]